MPDISLFAPSQANGRLLSRKKPFTSMLAFATPNVPKDLSMPKAALVSLATSVPPHVFLQKDVLAAAWDVFGPRFPEFDRFSSIFSNTGIIKRHAVKPFDWYLESRGWPERTAAFLSGAEELFVEVAEKALADAHRTGAEIDTVVTVCSTGIATPSLEARVAGRMGFRSDVMRVPGTSGRREMRISTGMFFSTAGTTVAGCSTFAPK